MGFRFLRLVLLRGLFKTWGWSAEALLNPNASSSWMEPARGLLSVLKCGAMVPRNLRPETDLHGHQSPQNRLRTDISGSEHKLQHCYNCWEVTWRSWSSPEAWSDWCCHVTCLEVTGSSLDPGATLLLLTPKPSASPRESLAANIAAKCLKLHDEAAARPEGRECYNMLPASLCFHSAALRRSECR